MINNKQCTVVLYVDDNKISHKDSAVVSDIIGIMKKYFGNITVIRGSKHRFLGMNITINKNKSIEIKINE